MRVDSLTWFYRFLALVLVLAILNLIAGDPLGVSAYLRGDPIDPSCYVGDKSYPDGVPDNICD